MKLTVLSQVKGCLGWSALVAGTGIVSVEAGDTGSEGWAKAGVSRWVCRAWIWARSAG